MNRFNPSSTIAGQAYAPMEPHPKGEYVKAADAIIADDLVGINEITKMYDMSKALLCCWCARTSPAPFPTPIKRLAMGPVYSKREVRAWMKQHKPLYKEKA